MTETPDGLKQLEYAIDRVARAVEFRQRAQRPLPPRAIAVVCGLAAVAALWWWIAHPSQPTVAVRALKLRGTHVSARVITTGTTDLIIPAESSPTTLAIAGGGR